MIEWENIVVWFKGFIQITLPSILLILITS